MRGVDETGALLSLRRSTLTTSTLYDPWSPDGRKAASSPLQAWMFVALRRSPDFSEQPLTSLPSGAILEFLLWRGWVSQQVVLFAPAVRSSQPLSTHQAL